MKKTFLLFVPWMVPGGADRCGVDMLRHYRLKGWRTVVCSTRENIQGNLWRHEFGKWADHVLDLGPEWRRGKHIEAIHSIVAQCHPRVVCINNSHEAHECVRMIRKMAPDCLLTCLLHMNIPGPWDFPGRAAKQAESYDKILCVSDSLAESVRKRITTPSLRKRVETLKWFPWWPSSKKFDREAVRAELGLFPHDKVAISPMRICEQKNPLKVVAVAKIMQDAKFLIAGDGEMRQQIEAVAPPNLTVTGYVSQDDMPRMIEACDCVFLPSRDEGIPLAFMESLACGVPVVASDVGGVSELLPKAALLDRDAPDRKWATTIAKAFTGKLISKASCRSVVEGSGAFSFETWRANMNSLLSDEHVQAAPLVRISKAVPLVKTFVIGAPKTGTSSVGAALEMMGCRVKGFDAVLQDYFHHGHDRPALDQVTMFDAFADGPFNTGEFYKRVDARFPGSRFILTLRDEKSWLTSHRAHFAPDGSNVKVRERFRLLEYDEEEWLQWYQRRNAEVRRYFSERRNLLLEIDVFRMGGDELWKALADHVPGLRAPALGTPFPHVNKTTHATS